MTAMPEMSASLEEATAMSQELQDVFASFNRASQRIEGYYSRLEDEVNRLTRELETANRKLRGNLAEKERMQAILVSTLQNLTHGVLAVGRDGVVIVANPVACRLFERSLEQLATQLIGDVLIAVPGHEVLLQRLFDEQWQSESLEWQYATVSGERRFLELSAIQAESPWDQELAGLIVIEDKTRLRQLEEQARLRSRLTGMGEIAMNLAHEIRNPLGSIALFASALQSELAEREDLKELADQIVHGVKSLNHLVTNTLDFARPRRMSFSRVNLAEVIEETMTYVQHPVHEKSIELQFDAGDDVDPEITGDHEQLRQVFLNLALNAIQAMDQGGRLRLAIGSASCGQWMVTVEDEGKGMTQDQVSRIFDPFFTTKEKGSGIGLSVVHAILAAHEARIEVDSEPGVGTVFRIYFPTRQAL